MNLSPELGSGPLDAAVWVLSRDSGYDARPASLLMDATLKAAGLRRDDVRLEVLNPKASRDPTDIEWGKWRLDALLTASRPKVVVACGDEVQNWLLVEACPEDGCQATRGYLWDTRYGRAVTTVEPHDFFTKLGGMLPWTPWRALLNLDMKRAVGEARVGCPPLVSRTVTIITEPRELDELREAIHDAGGSGSGTGDVEASRREQDHIQFQQREESRPPRRTLDTKLPMRTLHGSRDTLSPGWLAVDIENHADLTLACMGFAPDPLRAWVIPATSEWQMAAIRSLCESSVPKVLQNGQYDHFFLQRFAGITLRNQVFDTMLGWHALQPELAGKKMQVGARKKASNRTTIKSLKFLASIYTRDAWFKNYQFETESDRYILCGKDCCVTLEIAEKQAAQLEAT